ncbi:hypothetical protein DIPPA_10034 [Diplonema papillatum]|nr:hypothetical protein DIPPA_10034 [Diplonema papillatum]
MQCAICKSKLLYESLIGEYDVAADRGETRWELKGVDWLRRTKTHLQAGVVATCGQPCAGEWTRGAHAAPAVHTAAPDGQPCPPPLDGYVSMTTERYTVEQIEAVYRPVLVANIPEELPDALFRRILEHHGSVDAVVRDAGGGLALVVFSEGSAAERFFLTGHGMPLAPPELAARLPAPRAAAARRRLAVEFAMFLPEANRHLFDDLFGVKTTRQLLRAAPRRLSADGTPADPFPFTRAHCEALLFPAFRRHLRSSDAGPAVAADVALCRNWLLYKFNTGGGPREAAALLRKAGGSRGAAVALVDSAAGKSFSWDEDLGRDHADRLQRALRRARRHGCRHSSPGLKPRIGICSLKVQWLPQQA